MLVNVGTSNDSSLISSMTGRQTNGFSFSCLSLTFQTSFIIFLGGVILAQATLLLSLSPGVLSMYSNYPMKLCLYNHMGHCHQNRHKNNTERPQVENDYITIYYDDNVRSCLVYIHNCMITSVTPPPNTGA